MTHMPAVENSMPAFHGFTLTGLDRQDEGHGLDETGLLEHSLYRQSMAWIREESCLARRGRRGASSSPWREQH